MSLGRGQILKIIELVLVIICVFLHFNSMEASNNTDYFLLAGVYGGYLIIMVGVVLAFVLVDSAPGRRLEIYFTVLGAVLFLIAGYLSWDHFHGRRISTSTSNYGLTKAWVSVGTGIVFIVDAVLGFRD